MIIGMDFGTTHSGMASFDGQEIQTVPLNLLNPRDAVTPTTLYVLNEQKVHFGAEAIDTYFTQNLGRPVKLERVWVGEIEQTFAEIGTFVKDVYIWVDVLSPGRLFLSFKTDLSDSSYLGTAVGRFFYRLEDIITIYLNIAKRRAERYFDREIDQVILGRPVRFNRDPQANVIAQDRLLDAALRAGYKRVYFEYEPVAAAYHFERTLDKAQNVLVFDFGGGTLDVTIMRLGDATSRKVLATGGVPIAGDIFDQKLLRAKIPKHFGEGSTYRSLDKNLPVPSWIFEAFADWRTILSLQTPDTLSLLRTIAPTAEHRHQIEALISLVSSNYSFKMFDVVERVKRQLSTRNEAKIRLGGPGFAVEETVTRREFEHIILPEYREIESHVDETVRQSGLTHDEIDIVIRTGGSSQIPLFQRMLGRKFGEEKVRAVSLFGSVTSGLGIIGHQLETGEIDKECFTESGLAIHHTKNASTVPPINLPLVMAQLEIQEEQLQAGNGQIPTGPSSTEGAASPAPERGFVALSSDYELTVARLAHGRNESDLGYSVPASAQAHDLRLISFVVAELDEPLLLLTSAYRLLLVTLGELLTYQEAGASVRDLHGFDRTEQICGLNRWNVMKQNDLLLLISTQGAARKFELDQIGPRIEGTTPPRIDWALGGWPRVACAGSRDQDLLLVNSAARASRTALAGLPVRGGRVFSAKRGEQILTGHCVGGNDGYPLLLIVSNSGFGKAFQPTAVSLATKPAAQSSSIARRRGELTGIVPITDNLSYSLLTNHRLAPIDLDMAVLSDAKSQSMHPLLKLSKDERVLGVISD